MIALGITLLYSSCSDEFLKSSEQRTYQVRDTLYISQRDSNYIAAITIPIMYDGNYTIVSQPKCMAFARQNGSFSGGTTTVEFTTDMGELYGRSGNIGQQIVLKADEIGFLVVNVVIKRPSVPVVDNFPILSLSSSFIDLKNSESKALTLGNVGKQILSYQIYDIPAWLNVSNQNGNLAEGESLTVNISAKNTGLQDGDYSAIMQVYTNTSLGTYGVQVTLHIQSQVLNPLNTKAIQGKVTDAEYSRGSGKLVITTQSPNQLVIFSNDTVQSVLPLTKAPNCVSISEDGKSAVIGYNQAAISTVDLEGIRIVKTIETDCIAFDVVCGDNNWCYIISDTGDYKALRSMNTETGEYVKTTDYSRVHSKMIIRKIPGEPYLLGSNTEIYSNGLIMIDISSGAASDIIPYWSIDTNNFWIAPDAKKIYTGIKNVFRIPEYPGNDNYFSDLPIIAKLPAQKENVVWVDQSDPAGSIFVAESSRQYDSEEYSFIERIDPESYSLIRQYTPDRFQTTIAGYNGAYQTLIKYLFVSKDGSRLFAVKNVLRKYQTDAWSMEMISVD